jgi:DNA repair protein SbcD/Mre11
LMRLIHFSDTHLGYTAYRRFNEAGYNQRGEDIYNAFTAAIDKILELKPDLVVHTGDLFDSPRPQNRIITKAYKQLLRFKKAGIPLVLISGNHETPKQKGAGSVFSLLDLLEAERSILKDAGVELKNGDILGVYNGYQKIVFKDLIIHAVSHCENQEVLDSELAKIKIQDNKKNIGLFHAGVAGLKEFRMSDFNEQLIQPEFLKDIKFDYIGLGHLHRMVQVADRAWFAGSTEHLSFNELKQRKGFLEIELNTLKVTPHYLEVRIMEEFEAYDAHQKTAGDIMSKFNEEITNERLEDKILRWKITNIAPETYKALDFTEIRKKLIPALHFELILEKYSDDLQAVQEATIKGLTEEFSSFIKEQELTPEMREFIQEKGLKLLADNL